MDTVWERAAHVNCIFSLLSPFVALVVSHFSFEFLYRGVISNLWSFFRFGLNMCHAR